MPLGFDNFHLSKSWFYFECEDEEEGHVKLLIETMDLLFVFKFRENIGEKEWIAIYTSLVNEAQENERVMLVFQLNVSILRIIEMLDPDSLP